MEIGIRMERGQVLEPGGQGLGDSTHAAWYRSVTVQRSGGGGGIAKVPDDPGHGCVVLVAVYVQWCCWTMEHMRPTRVA